MNTLKMNIKKIYEKYNIPKLFKQVGNGFENIPKAFKKVGSGFGNISKLFKQVGNGFENTFGKIRKYFKEEGVRSSGVVCNKNKGVYNADCITADRIVQFLVQDIIGTGINTDNFLLREKMDLYELESFIKFSLELLLKNENGIVVAILNKNNKILQDVSFSNYTHIELSNSDFSNGRDYFLICFSDFTIVEDKYGYKGIVIDNQFVLNKDIYVYLNWNNKKTVISDSDLIGLSFYDRLLKFCENLESMLDNIKTLVDMSKILVIQTKLFNEMYASNVTETLEKIGEFGSYTVIRMNPEDSISNIQIKMPDIKPIWEGYERHLAMLSNIPYYILFGREHGSLASGDLANTEVHRYFKKLEVYRNFYIKPIMDLFIRRIFNLQKNTKLIKKWELEYYIGDFYNYDKLEEARVNNENNNYLSKMYELGIIDYNEYREKMGFQKI